MLVCLVVCEFVSVFMCLLVCVVGVLVVLVMVCVIALAGCVVDVPAQPGLINCKNVMDKPTLLLCVIHNEIITFQNQIGSHCDDGLTFYFYPNWKVTS